MTCADRRQENSMNYISYAEREGIRKGVLKGEFQEAKKILLAVMHAKFGPEAVALVYSLGERGSQDRMESLIVAAALAPTLESVRIQFDSSHG
jgi:hypothetical protein